MNPAPSRPDLRRRLRLERRSLPVDQRHAASIAVARRITATRLFRSSLRIACYLAVDGELDTLPLLQRASRLGKEIYLPVLPTRATDRLKFARYRPGDQLENNRFGIPEPVVGARHMLKPARLDLVLAPLVSFDLDGNRLGMGGGFYDRTFAYLHQRTRWVKPRLVGLAYDFQRQTQLPAQPWDVPLHAIATERHLYLPARR